MMENFVLVALGLVAILIVVKAFHWIWTTLVGHLLIFTFGVTELAATGAFGMTKGIPLGALALFAFVPFGLLERRSYVRNTERFLRQLKDNAGIRCDPLRVIKLDHGHDFRVLSEEEYQAYRAGLKAAASAKGYPRLFDDDPNGPIATWRSTTPRAVLIGMAVAGASWGLAITVDSMVCSAVSLMVFGSCWMRLMGDVTTYFCPYCCSVLRGFSGQLSEKSIITCPTCRQRIIVHELIEHRRKVDEIHFHPTHHSHH